MIDVTPGFLSVPFGAYVAVAKASRIELGRADTGALGPVGGIASFLGRTVFQAFAFDEMTKRIAKVHMERQGILKKTKKIKKSMTACLEKTGKSWFRLDF